MKNRTCSTIKREYYSQKKKSHHRRHQQQPSAISSSRQCRQQDLCFSFLFFENNNDVSSRTSHQPPPPANDIDQRPHKKHPHTVFLHSFREKQRANKPALSNIVYAATVNTSSQNKSTPTSCTPPLSLSSIITSFSTDS